MGIGKPLQTTRLSDRTTLRLTNSRASRHRTVLHEQTAELRDWRMHTLHNSAIANARSRSTTSREDSTGQILTTGSTSQSREWERNLHCDITHASQYQSRSRAVTSRV